MDLKYLFATLGLFAATNTAAITISSGSFLRYFAIFDDVIYPAANNTLEPPSLVTIEKCAQLCFNRSAQREVLSRQSFHLRSEERPLDKSEQEFVYDNTHVETNRLQRKNSCFAFEYISSLGYCVLLKRTAAQDVHGYSALKNAKGTSYFELSKSVLDLFKKEQHKVLTGESIYQHINMNSSSVTNCANQCIMAADLACNSFAYSELTRICAISSHVPDVDILLQTTEIYDFYDFYQYTGEWPCNVTLPWGYRPRVIASYRYPYVSHGHVSCYFRLVAPPGQEIVLRVTTFITNQKACDDSETGLFIFDNDEISNFPEHLCQMSDGHRHQTFKSSNGSLVVKISQGKNWVTAKMIYGYEGKSKHCPSSPCLFNAPCVETEFSFKCLCPHGTDGKRCEKYIGECFRNPCKNGTCYPSGYSSGYKCACVKGYTGANCEYNINECFSSPCLHGNCEDLINDFKCICNEPYTGKHCELDKSRASCSRHECRFGTCAVNKSGSYCQCFPGFTGIFCETDIDDCEDVPCSHGACVDHVNSYQCVCSSGYAGKHCDILVGDPCRDNPCFNGYCSVGNEGFSCICENGYTGSKCESKLTVCLSECLNGYCIKINKTDSKCICYNNYTGKHCEIIKTGCKNGVCIDNKVTTIPNISESSQPTFALSLYQTALKSTIIPKIFTTTSAKRHSSQISLYQTALKSTITPKIFTTTSAKRHSSQISFKTNKVTLSVASSFTSDEVKGQSSTMPTHIISKPPQQRNKNESDVSYTPPSILTTDDVKSISEPASEQVAVETSTTIYESGLGASRTSSIKSTDSSNVSFVTRETHKTSRYTTVQTSQQNKIPEKEFTIKTISSTSRNFNTDSQLTTQRNGPSSVTSFVDKNTADATLKALSSNPLEGSTSTVKPKQTTSPETRFITRSMSVQTDSTVSSIASSQGESVNDVITIESITIGALFVALLIVLAMAIFAFYKRARSGTVYISSPEQQNPIENNTVRKRYSAREIHSDLRSGNLLKSQCVSSELYQRQDDARKPVYAMPKRRHVAEVSSSSGSSTISPVSSFSDNYDDVDSPIITLPTKIRRLVPVNEAADGRNVVKVTRGKGVITPRTPEQGRPRESGGLHQEDRRLGTERQLSSTSNENPFYKKDDGTIMLNLSEKLKRRTQADFQSLLEQVLDSEDYLTLRRPGMRKSVHYITGTEDGKSEA